MSTTKCLLWNAFIDPANICTPFVEIWRDVQGSVEHWINKGMKKHHFINKCGVLAFGRMFCLNGRGATFFYGTSNIPTHLAKLIGKSTFSCLANLKQKQFKKLAKGLLGKVITFCKHQAKGGGQLDLKSMYEFIRLLKWKIIIQKEIMVHFGHFKLTTNN